MLPATRTCPKCRGTLEQDGSCSCGYGARRSSASEAGPQMCTWSDRGEPCGYRAVMQLEGRWHCRQHGYHAQGWTGAGRGNQEAAPTKESLAVRAYHDAMAAYVERGGVPYKQRLGYQWGMAGDEHS